MKSHSTGSKAGSFRTSFNNNYLKDFGTPVTLNSHSYTLDSSNRVTGVSTSSSTIIADIQWVTKSEIQKKNLGQAEIGDGMIFVKYDSIIAINDEVVFNSKTYRVLEQIEGELVKGEVVYKGFVIRLNA